MGLERPSHIIKLPTENYCFKFSWWWNNDSFIQWLRMDSLLSLILGLACYLPFSVSVMVLQCDSAFRGKKITESIISAIVYIFIGGTPISPFLSWWEHLLASETQEKPQSFPNSMWYYLIFRSALLTIVFLLRFLTMLYWTELLEWPKKQQKNTGVKHCGKLKQQKKSIPS